MRGFGDQNKFKKNHQKIKKSKEQILNQAIQFHLKGNIKEAIKYYQQLISQGYNDHRIFSNYGVILQSQDKLNDAEISLKKAIELKPDYAEAYSNLGQVFKDLGKLKDAESSYRKAIALNPNYAIAYFNLGNLLKDLGKLKDAEIAIRKAIALNPDLAQAYSNLGNILTDLGKLKDAELSYRKAIALNPNYAIAYFNLGNLLKDLGNLQESELSYRKAITMNPELAEAYSNLGNILTGLGKLKDAEILCRKAIAINQDYPEAHNNLGRTLIHLGKLRDAEKSTRKAIKLDPDYGDAHNNLGNILRDLGEYKELLLLSKSILKSKSINKGCKLLASLQITITNLLRKDFSETQKYLNKTKDLINQDSLNAIDDEKNKKHLVGFYQFITALYPLLEKDNKHFDLNLIPHLGESHCLSFAHQNISLSSQLHQIQPVLMTGGKAWHFANNQNNQWKDSLTQQIKNHTYSDKVFISFGEIDCRKDEGILNYVIKNNKNILTVCAETIRGYVSYMEKILSQYYSERYYFGIPAPKKESKFLDALDIKRIKMINSYNKIIKKEVLSRGSHFLDVYQLTSNSAGLNNNLHMCDDYHLSPKSLPILFKNYLHQSKF